MTLARRLAEIEPFLAVEVAERAQAMEREGIDVAILYPTRGLHTLARSDLAPPVAAALARAYNNWMYDFCAPDRARPSGRCHSSSSTGPSSSSRASGKKYSMPRARSSR